MMIFQKQKLKLNLFKNQAPFTGVVGPLPNGPFLGVTTYPIESMGLVCLPYIYHKNQPSM